MAVSAPDASQPAPSRFLASLQRRYREFALIARDPVLMIGLLFCGLFLFIFVVYPLYRGTANGFVDATVSGPWYTRLSLKYFLRYFDSYYGPYSRQIFLNTLEMGLLSATGGTILGFIFAYTMVRCNAPFSRFIHLMALVPTVSPPFALALSTILLLGRNGLVSHKLLGMNFGPGINDIYGLDGLVFVQVITFFSVAYLIVRAMLERLDPSMEEAAHSLGAGKLHIFRTVTLPLLIPGIAGSFLLLFVESLADLGNPLFISGNFTVLSAQIWLAVAGEYDYQKASALAFVLLLPTLIVFLVQRYYVTRRSYVSVTGKPTGGHITVREPWIRWPFIIVTYLTCALVILLYAAIIYGSFATAWGTDFTPTLAVVALDGDARGGIGAGYHLLERVRDANRRADRHGDRVPGGAQALLRQRHAGFRLEPGRRGARHHPGHRLRAGVQHPAAARGGDSVRAAGALPGPHRAPDAPRAVDRTHRRHRSGDRAGAVDAGAGRDRSVLPAGRGLPGAGPPHLAAAPPRGAGKGIGWMLVGMGLYLFSYDLIDYVAQPIAQLSRSIPRGFWSNAIFQVADHIKVFFQTPAALTAIVYTFLSLLALGKTTGRGRVVLTTLAVALIATLCFMGKPLALVGTPFIIIAAFVVRSLPASVRAGVAALQQIDPSIEEASAILGGDAQYTFRKVTLPLIVPALLAGLIFSFTRHMTSLSAIIFLVSARWRIVTASILSEWEQGGISIAAGYSTVIIIVVFIAIGILYFVTRKLLGGRGDVDLTLGA